MNEETAQTAEPQIDPKWVSMTQTIRKQINEARETTGRIRDTAGFILRSAAPTPAALETDEDLSMESKSEEHRRTVDNSPLSIMLNGLQLDLSNLNEALSEIYGLIDV